MVKLNHALKSDKGIFMGITRAKDLFFEVATIAPDDNEPSIDFKKFITLIGLILKESNTEAKKKKKATVPVPSIKDLQVLFNRADEDNSKSVDEYEFLGLYQAVMDGHVKGLGDSVFSFYVRPHQLMQFGQHEHHPDTDWQDLFFDLLFVGGAYQTGNFLASALIENDNHSFEGVIWSFAIFTCLAQQWFMKMLLSARFGYSSMFHYFLDNAEFMLLAFAMWHIPAYDVTIPIHGNDSSYSSYSEYGSSSYSAYSSTTYSAYSSSYARKLASSYDDGGGDDYLTYSPLEQMKYNVQGRTFGFSICIAINNLLYVFKWMEIVTDKEATSGAVTISRHQAGAYIAVTVLYLIASRLSFQKPEDKNGLSEYVLYLWIFSTIIYIASFYYWVHFLHLRKAQGRLQKSGVPMNVNYVIHRVGEFCMLMIGETVLSLLVVNLTPEWKNYIMFGSGMVIACNLHFHHFSTYPPDPSRHVLHKGTFDFRSLSYICTMIYLYPFSLILIGVCLKVLLKKADYGQVFNETNWVLSFGLCFQYCLINFFVYIHDRSRGKDKRWKPFIDYESRFSLFKSFLLKAPTLIALLIVAALDLRPYPMLMYSFLILVLQSALILYLAKTEDEDDQLEIAHMDFEYQQSRLGGMSMDEGGSMDFGGGGGGSSSTHRAPSMDFEHAPIVVPPSNPDRNMSLDRVNIGGSLESINEKKSRKGSEKDDGERKESAHGLLSKDSLKKDDSPSSLESESGSGSGSSSTASSVTTMSTNTLSTINSELKPPTFSTTNPEPPSAHEKMHYSRQMTREKLKRRTVSERIVSQEMETLAEDKAGLSLDDVIKELPDPPGSPPQPKKSTKSSKSSKSFKGSSSLSSKDQMIANNVKILKAFDVMKEFNILSNEQMINIEKKISKLTTK